MTNENKRNVEIFFDDPRKSPEEHKQAFGGFCSVLYALRRDISTCLGVNITTGEKIPYKVIWPGCMAILAGIDLLGKFFAGSDEVRKVGDRFINFVKEYFENISSTDAEIIYQLRNALLHSFGLYSKDKNGKIYNFTLIQNHLPLVQYVNNDYLVDVWTFYIMFESAVKKYSEDVRKNKSLQCKFESMFSKYGQFFIGTIKIIN
jgi:hypothetical protein